MSAVLTQQHMTLEHKWKMSQEGSTTKKRGSQRQEEGTTEKKTRGGRSSPLLFGGAPFGVLIFFLFPVGWCRSPFSPKKLRLVRLTEVQFSSVEWRSLLLLPFRCTAFLCLLSDVLLLWVVLPSSSSFGWGKIKKTPAQRAGGGTRESTTIRRRKKPSSTTQQNRGEKQLHRKDGKKVNLDFSHFLFSFVVAFHF